MKWNCSTIFTMSSVANITFENDCVTLLPSPYLSLFLLICIILLKPKYVDVICSLSLSLLQSCLISDEAHLLGWDSPRSTMNSFRGQLFIGLGPIENWGGSVLTLANPSLGYFGIDRFCSCATFLSFEKKNILIISSCFKS